MKRPMVREMAWGNMRKRMGAIGGEFKLVSEPGRGTTVKFRVVFQDGKSRYVMNPAEKSNNRPQPPIKVVIVEDEAWLRENLAREIGGAPGFCCVNKYRTAEAALLGIPADQPDVVLMDINLPGMDGVECIRRLRTSSPQSRCLIFTVYEESDKIFQIVVAGASLAIY